MTTTKVATQQTTKTHATEKQVTQPRVVPLAKIVQSVREDSRCQADRYLDEVVVPLGGE